MRLIKKWEELINKLQIKIEKGKDITEMRRKEEIIKDLYY